MDQDGAFLCINFIKTNYNEWINWTHDTLWYSRQKHTHGQKDSSMNDRINSIVNWKNAIVKNYTAKDGKEKVLVLSGGIQRSYRVIVSN